MGATIGRGSKVVVETAYGDEIERRALSGVEEGEAFPVIWVCTEEEWLKARTNGGEAKGTPWPVDHVRPAQEARTSADRAGFRPDQPKR